MMAGDDPKLFYRCPFERVVAFPFSMAVQSYYSRLFIDPGRLLEDAALLIGTMTLRHTEHPLPNESVYGRSLINYCRDNIEWTRKRHEERDREEAKLKAFLDGVQGVERTKRSHRELI
jgi:hypothetical protein